MSSYEFIRRARRDTVRHAHDCDNCEPVGTVIQSTWVHQYDSLGVTERIWDCYICIGDDMTAVARHSDEPSDYQSRTLYPSDEPILGNPVLAYCVQAAAWRFAKERQHV